MQPDVRVMQASAATLPLMIDRDKLEQATAAIAELEHRGVTATRVEFYRQSATVIAIEPPPVSSWIRGAMRRRIDGVREYAAPFQGCQLRWRQTDDRAA